MNGCTISGMPAAPAPRRAALFEAISADVGVPQRHQAARGDVARDACLFLRVWSSCMACRFTRSALVPTTGPRNAYPPYPTVSRETRQLGGRTRNAMAPRHRMPSGSRNSSLSFSPGGFPRLGRDFSSGNRRFLASWPSLSTKAIRLESFVRMNTALGVPAAFSADCPCARIVECGNVNHVDFRALAFVAAETFHNDPTQSIWGGAIAKRLIMLQNRPHSVLRQRITIPHRLVKQTHSRLPRRSATAPSPLRRFSRSSAASRQIAICACRELARRRDLGGHRLALDSIVGACSRGAPAAGSAGLHDTSGLASSPHQRLRQSFDFRRTACRDHGNLAVLRRVGMTSRVFSARHPTTPRGLLHSSISVVIVQLV